MSTELTDNDPVKNPMPAKTAAAVTPDSLETETPAAVEALSREDEILIRYRQAQTGGEALPIE
jgi:hypothetical protein